MDPSAAADLEAVLAGVPLPATKDALLEYAVQRHAEPALISALRSLPERTFESLDAVAEEAAQVRPDRRGGSPEPREESGAPPGGDDYTHAAPESGAVREF